MFIVNVEGAIRKNDKWLIIERSKKEEHAGGLLSLVGGKVDIEGSSSNILERTVKREIFEEVGVKANLIDDFRVVDEHIIPSKVDTVKQIVYFLAEYKNQNVKFQKSELSAVKLLAFDEAYNTFEYESSKRILSAAYDYLSKAVY